jgi:hypothetical protein
METISVNIAEEVLKEFDIEYDDLTPAEQEIYDRKYFNLKRLTVGDMKTYIARMKNAVAMQLCDTEGTDPKDALLKARLKNYILQEAFLISPDKAEEALRRNIKASASKSTKLR